MTQHTDRMLAVVKAGEGVDGIEIREVPVPIARPGFAVLEVVATGLCGTDVHIAHDEYSHERPVVMGHEVLGRVVEVDGTDDADWIGALVAVETYFAACEQCRMCRDGRRNLCTERRSIGSFRDGGFASRLLVPIINLHRLPATPGPIDGVLSEPLACITQCLFDPPVIQAGDRVLVTGPGAMGQLAAQVARACGADVLLVGLPADAERLAIAASLGIRTSIERPEVDAFDVVIECSGSAGGIAVAFGAARRGARYVQVGIAGRDVQIPFDTVLYKELTVTSGFASTPASWASAMRLIESGAVTLEPLITNRVPLERFADALAATQRGEGIKTVIVPTPAE